MNYYEITYDFVVLRRGGSYKTVSLKHRCSEEHFAAFRPALLSLPLAQTERGQEVLSEAIKVYGFNDLTQVFCASVSHKSMSLDDRFIFD